MELSLHFQVWKLICAYKKRDALAWHTPNGEKRDRRTAARLKAMGVVPGVGDFTIIVAGKPNFLELKDGKRGTQNKDQETFQCDAEAAGASYYVARTLDEACTVLNDIGALRVRLTSSGVRGGPGAQPGAAESPALPEHSPRRTEATV